MFKFKRILTVLLLVIILSLFTVVFANWKFSEDATEQSTVTANITDVEVSGDLTADITSFKVLIDQKELKWVDSEGVAVTQIVLTYTGSDDTSVNETVNFTDTVTNGLSAYINVGAGSFNNASVTYTGEAITVTYTLPTLTWVTDMKPGDATENSSSS